jgi:2-iminobutanoate/2-iminopropanoate deaminase
MHPPAIRRGSAAELDRGPVPYSLYVAVDRMVFVSGQASTDRDGRIVPDSFEGEFRRSLANLQEVLAAAGCSLHDVVQTRNYVRDEDDLALYNRLYAEHFPEPRPARTTITGCLPKTLRYEIECVAVRPA